MGTRCSLPAWEIRGRRSLAGYGPQGRERAGHDRATEQEPGALICWSCHSEYLRMGGRSNRNVFLMCWRPWIRDEGAGSFGSSQGLLSALLGLPPAASSRDFSTTRPHFAGVSARISSPCKDTSQTEWERSPLVSNLITPSEAWFPNTVTFSTGPYEYLWMGGRFAIHSRTS